MHSTPNDHIYYLPMGLRVEKGLKWGVQDRPRREARSEIKFGEMLSKIKKLALIPALGGSWVPFGRFLAI